MNPHDQSARELAAKLLPHTTSVHNVELIAEALRAAHDAGVKEGLEKAANKIETCSLVTTPKHQLKLIAALINSKGPDTASAEMAEFGDHET